MIEGQEKLFELNHLRSFVVVAAELNFRRAATRLNMTQPPLSRQIQQLEYEIGVLLFDRSGRSIRLTAAGERFLAEARDLLRRAEIAALSARRAEAGKEGTVVLGFIPVAALDFLPEVISALQTELPDVELILKEMQTVDQVEALPADTIDLGIMRLPQNLKGLKAACIRREHYILAVPKNHAWAMQENLNVNDLHGQDFLMYSPSEGNYSYENLNNLFVSSGVEPNFVQFLGQSLSLLSMVDAGLGLALVPKSSEKLAFSNVVLKPIELPRSLALEHYLSWTQRSLPNPVVNSVRDVLLQRFGIEPKENVMRRLDEHSEDIF